MLRNRPEIRPLSIVLALAVVAILTAMPATAGEETPAAAPVSEEAAADAPTATSDEEAVGLSGLTIGWNAEARQFHQLSAAEAELLQEQFRDLLAQAKAIPLTDGDTEAKAHASGGFQARLPAGLWSTAVIRLADDGSFVEGCSDLRDADHGAPIASTTDLEVK